MKFVFILIKNYYFHKNLNIKNWWVYNEKDRNEYILYLS